MKLRTFINVLARVIRHPLNKGRAVRAVWRFTLWQIRARSVGKPIVFKWIDGAKLSAKIGDAGITGNIYNGLQEFEDMSFLLHVLRPSDLFIDVGANAGAYSVLASKVVGSRTVAFEPVPDTYQRLMVNLRLNNLVDLVDAHNLGLGENAGSLRFSSQLDSMNRVLMSQEMNDSSIVVRIDKLDNIVKNPAAIMKIDVEGFEWPVLKGAVNQLAQENLIGVILELNGSGEKYGFRDSEIINLMGIFGFSPFSYDPWRRQFTDLNGKNHFSGNTIFVRDIGKVEERAKSGPAFEVNGLRI